MLIRPYKNGIVMHTAYYADKIRDFSQIPKAESVRIGREELKLAEGLIERLSVDDFHPEQFKDEYRLRVLAMLEEKRKGEEITIGPEPKPKEHPERVIDIMQALKQSMERVPAQRKVVAAGEKRRKKVS